MPAQIATIVDSAHLASEIVSSHQTVNPIPVAPFAHLPAATRRAVLDHMSSFVQAQAATVEADCRFTGREALVLADMIVTTAETAAAWKMTPSPVPVATTLTMGELHDALTDHYIGDVDYSTPPSKATEDALAQLDDAIAEINLG